MEQEILSRLYREQQQNVERQTRQLQQNLVYVNALYDDNVADQLNLIGLKASLDVLSKEVAVLIYLLDELEKQKKSTPDPS